MNKPVSLFIIVLLFMSSCLPESYKYPKGSLPSSPVNLEAFNTEYDDYNSTAPIAGTLIPFCFSTNRQSEGGDYDIIYEPMNIEWNKNTGILTVSNNYNNWTIYQQEYMVLEGALDIINTEYNELGPYFIIDGGYHSYDYDYLFLYATDKGGDFQICFTYNIDFPEFNDSQEIAFLNSSSDDLYPAFNSDFSRIYFCSDRDNGVFNIYSAGLIRSYDSLVEEFTDESSTRDIILHENLSSDGYNDKCPIIYSNIMVFASDRPGGQGGYDLYYSIYEEDEWSDPVNFGPDINSPADEYRPIIINDMVDDDKDMMVFSSNREGGKGGFDLYFVGIDKMGESR